MWHYYCLLEHYILQAGLHYRRQASLQPIKADGKHYT